MRNICALAFAHPKRPKTPFINFRPSFLVIWAIASVFLSFQDNPIVQAAFKGLRSAVLGMIIVAALSIGNIAISGLKSIIIVLEVILGVSVFKLHPMIVFIISGIIGIMFFK